MRMKRYLVLRTDTPDGADPVVPIEGDVEVQGGALVFRKSAFVHPFLIIAPGLWAEVWLDTEEGA